MTWSVRSFFFSASFRYQMVMVDLDGATLIDITGPEDDGAPPAPIGPVTDVTTEPSADGLLQPVLRQESASQVVIEPADRDDLIRQIAGRPGIGGRRKIAAALEAEYGINTSHMTVKRVLDARK